MFVVFIIVKNVETIIKSFEVKDELSSEIWSNPTDKPMNEVDASSLKLKPEIRERLLKIAELFIDYVKVGVFVEDIRMTGSLANYNWSEYSDVDLHIITSLSNYGKDSDLYDEFFNLKKKAFNLKHDIKIKGYDVELYIEDSSGGPRFSAGIYSVLDNDWVISPKRENPKIDLNKVKEKSEQWMEIIDGVIDAASNEDIETASELFKKYGKKLKTYRECGLKKGGEYSYENLVFKVLRRNGYIGKFKEAEDKIIDKQLSLKENRIF